MIHRQASFSCLLLAAALTAQQPVPDIAPADAAVPQSLLVPVHTEQVGAHTELWAAGSTFKASFHDGLTFYPYVGPDLPHQPFAWRTTAVTAGGVAVPLQAPAAPEHAAHRVVYDLGVVRERYDLHHEGIEQSFVLERPIGAGDVAITGTVTSPLTAPPTPPRHGPLSFVGANGRVRVGYGAATAIDADGRRLPLQTSCDGARVTLHVPGSWLSTASYPVVVDPFLDVGQIAAPGLPVGDSDVLHETTSPAGGNGRVWVVYVFEAAAGDRDLMVDRHSSGFGAVPTTVFSRISAAVSTDNGSIALSQGSDNAVIVFDELNVTQNRYLGLHVHDVFDMTFSSLVAFRLPPADTHYWRPDVGGRIDATGTEIVIVWQLEENTTAFANTPNSRIVASTLNPALFPAGWTTNIWAVRWEPTRDQERPAINQAATEPDWVVVMTENDNTPGDDWDIVFGTVDGNGNGTYETITTEEAPLDTVHQQSPQIAGCAGRYLITYTTNPVAGSGPGASVPGNVVRTQRVDFPRLYQPWGSGAAFLPHPGVTLATLGGAFAIPGGVAYDHVGDSHWCATFRDNSVETLRAYKLGYTGKSVENAIVHTAPAANLLSVGGVAFRADVREFVATYGQYGAGQDQLRAARVQYDAVQPPTLFGTPCGTAGFTGLSGLLEKQQIGSQGVPLRMSGASPSTGAAILVISTAPGFLSLASVGLGNCDLLVDAIGPGYIGLVLTIVPSSGEAEVLIDLPESLGPDVFFFQWLYVDPADPSVLSFFATERLRFPTAR